jgi:hypothetical protein
MDVTVFWKHPYHGEGSFQVDTPSLEAAATEAAESLPSDLADDEADDLEHASILDDLDIVVFVGKHQDRPSDEPDYTFK